MKKRKFPKIINKRGYRKCAEIGVFKGRFSKFLLERCKEISIICVDTWSGIGMSDWVIDGFNGDKEYENLKNFFDNNYPGRVTLIRKTSSEASLEIQEEYLDFIYIDASHDYESTLNDLNNWYPKLRKGGTISGHDYSNCRSKKVKRAVDEFFCNKKVNITTDKCKCWWVTK